MHAWPERGCCAQPVQATAPLTPEQRALLEELLGFGDQLSPPERELFESLMARNQQLKPNEVSVLQEFLTAKQAALGLQEPQPAPPSEANGAPPPAPPPTAANPPPPTGALPDFVYHPMAPPRPL